MAIATCQPRSTRPSPSHWLWQEKLLLLELVSDSAYIEGQKLTNEAVPGTRQE